MRMMSSIIRKKLFKILHKVFILFLLIFHIANKTPHML
nr:MAG TPA: hypothetical protein [Caudoviricetes sp.]